MLEMVSVMSGMEDKPELEVRGDMLSASGIEPLKILPVDPVGRLAPDGWKKSEPWLDKISILTGCRNPRSCCFL